MKPTRHPRVLSSVQNIYCAPGLTTPGCFSVKRCVHSVVSTEHRSPLGALAECPWRGPRTDPLQPHFRCHSQENGAEALGGVTTVLLSGRTGEPFRPKHPRGSTGIGRPTWPISGRTELWKTPPGRKRAQKAHRVRARGCDGGEMPRRATQRNSPELEGTRGSQRCPARLPAPVPGVGLGQRAAAQAGAPPGGAQSPALTQLKAGAAALPCPFRLFPVRSGTHRLR